MVEKGDYLVYDRLIVPVKLHYYGYTDDIEERTRLGYKKTALQFYLDQYGWDNINTTIVTEGLTKKEAELLEDKLIREGWERGDCINIRRSGGYQRDTPLEYYKHYHKEHKEEWKQWYKDHREERLEYNKQYRENHREERLEYKKQYRENHREEIKEYSKQHLKQLRSTPEGKIYNRVNSFNQRHPDKIIETPLEAKQKYLQRGYIPDYIKNDDLNADMVT